MRELLKLAQLLYDAHRNATKDDDGTSDGVTFDIGPGHKFTDMRTTRAVSADIIKYGSRLHDVLSFASA